MAHARPLRTGTALRVLPVVLLVLLTGALTVDQPRASAGTLGEAQQEAAELRATLAALRTRSSDSIAKLEQAELELSLAVTTSISLSEELDAARVTARGADVQLGRRVTALYRAGGSIGLWATVLQARTPAEMLSRKANIDAVVASDDRLRDTAEMGSERLAGLEERASVNATVRSRAAQTLQVEEAALARSMAEQTAVLAGATGRVRAIVEQQRQVAVAAAARRLAQQQAAARAAAALAVGGPLTAGLTADSRTVGSGAVDLTPTYAGPTGACPVGPAHSFVDTWGAPRSGGRRHQGTDVFAPYGSPAHAVVDGVIEKWGNGGLGGISLWLRGDDGDRYYYAHNSANLVPPGSRVQAGQVVAFVGTTGNAATTPPHIHFEAHPGGGAAVNPYAWLAAICAA